MNTRIRDFYLNIYVAYLNGKCHLNAIVIQIDRSGLTSHPSSTQPKTINTILIITQHITILMLYIVHLLNTVFKFVLTTKHINVLIFYI